MNIFIALSVMIVGSLAQRGFYSGRSPIGYPVIVPSTSTTTAASIPVANELGERFGQADSTVPTTTTTVRLPLEAGGDADLVNRLSQLPLERQPFWLINWRALEAYRKNPQSYALKTNHFIGW